MSNQLVSINILKKCNVLQFLGEVPGVCNTSVENLVLIPVVISTAVVLSIIMGVLIWLLKVLCVCLFLYFILFLFDSQNKRRYLVKRSHKVTLSVLIILLIV